MPRKRRRGRRKATVAESTESDLISESLLFKSDFTDFNDLTHSKRGDSDSSSLSDSSLIDSDTADLCYAQLYFSYSQEEEEEGSKEATSSTTKTTPGEDVRSPSNGSSKESGQINDDDCDSQDLMVLCDTDESDNNTRPAAITREEKKRGEKDKKDDDNLWHIIEKDILGRDEFDNLYGFKRYNTKNVKCGNCRQKGHVTTVCPHPLRRPTCYLCSSINHLCSRCPQARCQYCFELNHRGRPCKPGLANLRVSCRRCFMSGHIEAICPEKWRQFHNTTDKDTKLVRLQNPKQSKTIYCSNCAASGHFAHECILPRPRGYPSVQFPLIAQYKDHEFPKNRKRKSKHLLSPETPDSADRHKNKKRKQKERDYDDDRTRMSSSSSDHHRRHSSHSGNHHSLLGDRISLNDHSTPLLPLPRPSSFHPDIRSLSFEHTRLPEDMMSPYNSDFPRNRIDGVPFNHSPHFSDDPSLPPPYHPSYDSRAPPLLPFPPEPIHHHSSSGSNSHRRSSDSYRQPLLHHSSRHFGSSYVPPYRRRESSPSYSSRHRHYHDDDISPPSRRKRKDRLSDTRDRLLHDDDDVLFIGYSPPRKRRH